MQTILGAGGQIATELARELHDRFGVPLRLVSRHPRAVHPSDEVFAADLTDPAQTDDAVAGSDIAYLTAGLPADAKLWAEKFPAIMRNAIDACARHGAKLVFFDNTYMYPRTAVPQTEDTPFEPVGRKSVVRAQIATMLLNEMEAGTIEAVICRAPEFYGPDKTQSLSNMAVFDRSLEEGEAVMAKAFGSVPKSNQAAVSREQVRVLRGGLTARELTFKK